MIRLGFEVGSGVPVDVPLGHMVVCGQTQLSGKTTLLEALASRSGRPVLAFRAKRGEGAFAGGARLPAYFEERADWQFVESILESTMRQRMKFERAWIMRACRGARTLAAVARNVDRLQREAKRGMDRDMYMMLAEYLAIVVPVLARLPRAHMREIRAGLNVVDMVALPLEVQGLVVASWLARVHREETGVVCVIPEAWKFLPQGRNSPVKLAATSIAREGAALGNYLWMDAQDLAGLEKEHQRGASVFCLGVQREVNEVKRNLALIPAGVKKPRVEDVATLGVGQFMVCRPGESATRAYVWPTWVTETTARAIAMDGRDGSAVPPIDAVARELFANQEIVAELTPAESEDQEEEMSETTTRAVQELTERVDRVLAKIDEVVRERRTAEPFKAGAIDLGVDYGKDVVVVPDEEALFVRFRERLMRDPKVLRILTTEKRIDVSVEVEVIEVDGKTLNGRVALLVRDGYFDEGKTGNAAWGELRRIGYPSKAHVPPGSLYEHLTQLAAAGFLTVDGKTYRTAAGAKARVKKAGG